MGDLFLEEDGGRAVKYSDIKTNPEVQTLIRKADANEDRLTIVAAIGHHDESTKATFKLVVNGNKEL